MLNVYRSDPDTFIELAEIFKALAHPQRLCIVNTLCHKERSNVNEMQDCLGEAQSTVSQHLAKLKASKIICGEREGTNVYYRITDERMRKLLKTIIEDVQE